MHLIPSFTIEGFYVGPFYIYTWGLTAAIGVIAAVFMASRKVFGSKITEDKFWNFAILLTIAVFLGARIQYIFEAWSYYAFDPQAIFRVWEGGFSFFGGAVGGILAGYIWSKLNKLNFLYLGWIFTPAWLVGLFFGRLGCFLIHDHLGKPTNLPWGIFLHGAYRHEPAMYEAVWILLIVLGLYWWERKSQQSKVNSRKSKNVDLSVFGQLTTYDLRLTTMIFPISLFLYSLGRFFIDFTRAEDDRFYTLTIAQWMCIVVIVWAISVILSERSEPKDPFKTN